MTPEQAKWLDAEALKRTGGQAFPVGAASFGPSGDTAFPENGMTLRDWFAGKAMAAALTTASATSEEYFPDLFKSVATQAYAQADAMLAERAK